MMETARYMQWRVAKSEEEARERMHKTISYQKNHDTYLIYEKKTGQAIGFAGVEEIGPQIFQDASIALGAKEFIYSTRAENLASNALAVSCGFTYRNSEQKTDMRNGQKYELVVYSRKLE